MSKFKSVYDIIKRQNGEAFAKAIRRFDSGIFDIPHLPQIVRYAGRDVEPLLSLFERDCFRRYCKKLEAYGFFELFC